MKYDDFLKLYEAVACPTPAELKQHGMPEAAHAQSFLTDGLPTEEYCSIYRLYRALLGTVLCTELDLNRLDERFQENGFLAGTKHLDPWCTEYGNLGLQFLFLYSKVHVERLSDENLAILRSCLAEQSDELLAAAEKVVRGTMAEILMLNPENPRKIFNVFPSLYGEGNFEGRSILFAFSCRADYDERGMLRDKAAEDRRIRVSRSVCHQFEQLASKRLNTDVRVIVEV